LFKLEDRRLYYYSDEKSDGNLELKGVINFDLYSCKVELDLEAQTLRINIKNCNRNFLLRCPEDFGGQ